MFLFAIIAQRLQKVLSVGALTSFSKLCTSECSQHRCKQRLFLVHPARVNSAHLEISMKRMLSVMSPSFFSPGTKEGAIKSFYSFCILMNNIVTVFRQPSDSCSGQNWGRRRVPRSLEGPSCPYGEKGASRSNSGFCCVPVNQMIVAFLLLLRVRVRGHFCSFTNCPAYSAYVAS